MSVTGASFIIGILCLTIIMQQWFHLKERAELLNRIMARDLGEYRTYSEDGVKIGSSKNFVQQAIKKVEAQNQAERG